LRMAPRLMLHATTIEFNHPLTGERIYGRSVCPF
jgi:tRNA pseudouridine32 synthase/23S rRNA pseudouridine746 synthase